MSLVSKAFSDIVTFSRSSNATRIGPTGRVEYAPHNLILRSQEFDNASWTKNASTVTGNAVASPSGTIDADKLISTVGAGGEVTQSISKSAAAITYTVSVYAKAAEFSFVQVAVYDLTSAGSRFWFNLSSGTVGFTSSIGAGFSATSRTIQSVGNGWYRCTCTFTTTSTASLGAYIYPTNGDGSVTAGDGTSGVYLWGAQLSVGPYPLDYTPTTSAAVYGPRFDYDPVTLAARGLLIEEQRTNLLTYSDDFSNAAWVKGSGFTLLSNSVTSPDGTVNADTYTRGTTASFAYLSQQVSGNASTALTYSCWVKSPSGSATIRMVISDVNLVSANSSLIAIGTTWQRISYTIAAGTLSNTGLIGVGFLLDTGQTIDVWGAQLEAGSFSTSYIPTVAASVTRSADVASVNTLSPWMNEVEGTIYAEVTSLTGVLALTNQSMAEIDTGVQDNRNKISRYEGVIYGTTTNGGVAQADFSLGNATSANTVYKAAYRFKANDFAGTINGGTVQTDTSGTVPSSLTKLWLGNNPNSDYLNGHLRRVAFYPRALTSSELQAITA
jgi:hypothetical protein